MRTVDGVLLDGDAVAESLDKAERAAEQSREFDALVSLLQQAAGAEDDEVALQLAIGAECARLFPQG